MVPERGGEVNAKLNATRSCQFNCPWLLLVVVGEWMHYNNDWLVCRGCKVIDDDQRLWLESHR